MRTRVIPLPYKEICYRCKINGGIDCGAENLEAPEVPETTTEGVSVPGDEEEEDGERGEGEEGEGETLEEGKEALKQALSNIVVESPSSILEEEQFDPDLFPPSYKDNNPKEQKVIRYCKTFLKQYNHLCNHRQPVFLKPKNEFGVEKMVCTAIQPHQLPFKDLLDWPDIAHFVAGYLNYDQLKKPDLLPKTLYSPQTVLERQRGHCFEYSTLLCSMLIGAGYDAFVVSGYATREVANFDLSYTKCPFVEDDEVVYTRPITLNISRYTARPPRAFKSEYMLRMLKKQEAEDREEEEIHKAAVDKERELREAPPPDPYYGYRVHSWVMILKGKRQVAETFFIEPSTGMSHPSDWSEYLGIETLWNHLNYYINMQQYEITGISDLKYDIGDSCDWEYIFPGQDLHIFYTPEEIKQRQMDLALLGDKIEEELHLDLPLSWSKTLYISREDYDRKYPTGMRRRRFKYTVVEDYCRYLNPDGLVRKIFRYNDIPCDDLAYTREIYADRADFLESRFLHIATGKVIEYFSHGRDDYIREHQYIAQHPDPENWRLLLYEPGKRADHLYKREEDRTLIRDYFKDRPDRKVFKEAHFGPNSKVYESPKIITPNSRPIEVVIEKFDRNPNIPADEDIATITFSVWSDEIDIEYHVADSRIVRSTRHFNKPAMWWDETQVLAWSADLHWSYEADVFARLHSELELYNMLMRLMRMESESRAEIRRTEKELRQMLRLRQREEEKHDLVKTYVQADEDTVLRSERQKLKAQEKVARMLAKADVLKDYLEPYIMSLCLPSISNKKHAQKVKDDCMQDLKNRLIAQASLIKECFEKEMSIIAATQAWYHSNFKSLSGQDIEDIRCYLVQHMFVGHILERRLLSLKEYAPIKYHDLYDRLMKDPRLEQYLF